MAETGGEEAAPTADDRDGDVLPVRDWWGTPDVDLQVLVGLANKFEIEIPIRLFIPAGVMSGSLIGLPTYFTRVAAVLRAAGNAEDNDVTLAMARNYAELADERAAEMREADLDSDVRHVHLDQATLHGPGADALPVGLWRGRLTSVSGWALGGYEPAGGASG